MASFSIDTNGTKDAASYLETVRDDLSRLKNRVQSEQNNAAFSSNIVNAINKNLSRIIRSLEKESLSIQDLSSALRDIANLYEQTEEALAKRKSQGNIQGIKGGGNDKPSDSDSGSFFDNILEAITRKFLEILEFLGLIPTGDDENSTFVSDPVNVCTGNYVCANTEILFSGTPALSFVRYYNSQYPREGAMGAGWTHNLEFSLTKGDGYVDVTRGDKGTERFYDADNDVFISKYNHFNYIVGGAGYTLHLHDGGTYRFDQEGRILSIAAQNGRKLLFEYEVAKLLRAYDEADRSLFYGYNDNGLLTSVTDSIGRKIELRYTNGLLAEVVSADGRKKAYAYDGGSRLVDITNNAGVRVIHNEFDDENRVVKQSFPDGTQMSFLYEGMSVVVTDRNGAVTTYRHNERYQITDEIRSDGTQHYAYEDNLRISYTDSMGAVFSRAYDSDGNVVSYTDALNNSVTLSYEERGLPSVVTERNGATTKREYDNHGNVTRYEDALGNETLFSYEDGSLVKIVQPDGSSVRFAYDKRGNLIARSDEMENTTTFVYDDAGRLVSRTDPRGMEYSFSYDPCDRLLSVKNPLGQLRTYEYGPTGKIRTVTDFDGFTETYAYNELDLCSKKNDKGGRTTAFGYDANGNLAEVILPNGGRILHEYDGYNRRTATVDELGLRTEYAYDGNGRLIRKSNGRLVTTIEYDPCGRAVRMLETASDDADGDTARVKQVARNAEGRVTQLTRPDGSVITYNYDLLGRCTERIDPIGAVTTYAYDSRGRLVSINRAGRELKQYSYYPNGKLRSVQNPGSGLVRYEYDAAGNKTKAIYPTGYEISYEYDELDRRSLMFDSLGRRVTYAYDKAGNLCAHTDALGNTSKFAYSPNGQIVRAEDALGNNVLYEYDMMDRLIGIAQCEGAPWKTTDRAEGSGTRHILFKRNKRGLITDISDADGNSSSFAYNEHGEMILRTTPEEVRTSFEYDAFGMNTGIGFDDGREVQKTFDVMGRLTNMEDWLGQYAISYDALGRISSLIDSDGQKISYEWDAFDGKTAMHYPDATAVHYDADDFGRLAQIRTENGTFRYSYDNNGRLSTKESPIGTVEYAYNSDGRVRSIVLTDRDGKASELSFAYDLRGNIHQRNEWTRENGTASITYEYDELNQISKIMENGKTVRRYSYDAFGNRVLLEENGTITRYVHNHLNQLVREEVVNGTQKRVTTWKYNADGHAIAQKTEVADTAGSALEDSGSLVRFRYDSASNLAGTERSDGTGCVYEYDGFGNRRSQATYGQSPTGTNGASGKPASERKTFFYYDYANSHMPLAASCVEDAFTDYVRDGELTGLIRDGKMGTYFCDAQGSVLAYYPAGDGSVCTYGYDEYGNQKHGDGSFAGAGTVQPFGFASMLWDAGSNTYLTRRRMYSPAVGRFLMRDDEQYIHLQNPQTVNLYEYCLNNPVMFVDPDGDDCYYFYLPEWENEALMDQQRLADQHGYGIDQVHIIPITNRQELTDGWNAMGTENGQPVDIETVVINSHANPYVLGFGQANTDSFTVSDAYALQDRSMDELVLYGCNAGHRDYIDENIADAFAHRVNNAPVMASDGTVYSDHSDYSYEPTNDDHFQYWAEQAGNGGRDNEGLQVYQQVDGRTIVTSTGVKDATIIAMLGLINQNRIKATRE